MTSAQSLKRIRRYTKKFKKRTFNKGDIEFTKRNDHNRAREISTGRKMKRPSMVIECGGAGSKGNTGDVVLNETVDVDDGGGVTELDAGD